MCFGLMREFEINNFETHFYIVESSYKLRVVYQMKSGYGAWVRILGTEFGIPVKSKFHHQTLKKSDQT